MAKTPTRKGSVKSTTPPKAKAPLKRAGKPSKNGKAKEDEKKVKVGEAARAGLKAYHETVKTQGYEAAADAAWTAQLAVQQRDNDRKDLIVAGEARKLVVGIPLPSLALMNLCQSNVLPMGRLYQVIGEEGSSKSSFLAEMMRWVLIHSGYTRTFETESKDIAELREAIWEYNQTWLDVRSLIDPCNTLEHWMGNLGSAIGEVTKIQRGLRRLAGPRMEEPLHLRGRRVHVGRIPGDDRQDRQGRGRREELPARGQPDLPVRPYLDRQAAAAPRSSSPAPTT